MLTDTTTSLERRNVLLVEDEAIVAMVTEDMLRDCGCAEVWTVATVQAAFDLLRERKPDLALLDVSLRGETSFPVAELLQRLQIPFALATGYGRAGLPIQWAHATVVPKPYTSDVLAEQLREALLKHSRGRGARNEPPLSSTSTAASPASD